MIIIIDGYNVLKQVVAESTQTQRMQFIRLLNRYARSKGHKIIVVFDAGPTWNLTKEVYESVTVVFVGAKETADDYIIRILPAYKNQETLLVSSDRQIIKNASRCGVESIDARHFYALLQADFKQMHQPLVSQAIKTTSTAHEERDALMRQASQLTVYKPDDASQRTVKGPSHTLSKSERKIMKKIGKL